MSTVLPPTLEINVDKVNQPHIPETADKEIVRDDDHAVTPPAVEYQIRTSKVPV